MATSGPPSLAVLDLAVAGQAAAEVARAAEDHLLARRAEPPAMRTACAEALAAAGGPEAANTTAGACALAIAAAVERHGAAFPPGAEPAYHDRHHQAEATLVMGWLTGHARRQGLIGAEEARLAVAAMAGHDLLHDGLAGAARGALERISAEASARIAEEAGLPPPEVAALRRIILATTWPWEEADAPDLLCRMAREADLFGSAMPRLGPVLARRLARELAEAGQPDAAAVASHAARVSLLRLLPPPTAAARAFGMEAVREAQLAAYSAVARRLGLRPASAEAGAGALDAMDEADALALLAHAGHAP